MDAIGISDVETHCFEAPKWLDVLENRRKRPYRLAHDIGAGSPCLVCNEKCKGLNLHFWRKICIECKCRKEDHDFADEEEYVQMEILLGEKKVKKTTLKHNALNKTFDWVPQNVSHELAIEYMNALPQSKLPISNTEGAIYRKQQLEKQLPVHDVDPNACHNLTDKEVGEFGKYLENLRNNVVGQGKVMKFKNYGVFRDRGSPNNAISSNHGGTKKLPYKVDGHAILVRDKTVESKTVFSEKINSRTYPPVVVPKADIVNYNEADSQNSPRHLNLTEQLTSKYDVAHAISNEKNPETSEKIKNIARSDLERAKDHKIGSSLSEVREQVFDNQNNNEDVCLNNLAGSTIKEKISHNLENYSDSFHDETFTNNIMNAFSHKLPYAPPQETHSLPNEKGDKEKVSIAVQDKSWNSNAGNISALMSQECMQCKKILGCNDVVINTERGGDSLLWHAGCFVCDMCGELLVDLMYFYHEGKVYCGRDYAKARNIPRCFACDEDLTNKDPLFCPLQHRGHERSEVQFAPVRESQCHYQFVCCSAIAYRSEYIELIFVDEYTQAEGQSYHLRHFCCYHCDEPLGGKQYVPKNNQPVCLECYQNYYGKTCSACAKPIPVADQRVSIGDFHFHVNSKCFRCMNCSRFLKGERFILKNEKTFCSKECFLQFQI